MIRVNSWLAVMWPLIGLVAMVEQPAAQEMLYHLDGEEQSDNFGTSVSAAGDVDGDSVPDFLVGSNGRVGNVYFGKIYLYSGATGQLLWSARGRQKGDGLRMVAGIGDIDGDGLADFLAGAPGATPSYPGAGEAYVFLGRQVVQAAQPLITSPYWIFEGHGSFVDFGNTVSCAGDLDADGVPDFVVGSPEWFSVGSERDKGRAYAYSGKDGSEMYTFTGESIEDNFASAIACAGDVDGDGHDDLIIGAPLNGLVDNTKGRAYLYSGKDGSLIRTHSGLEPSGGFAGAAVAGVGDIDGDGHADVLIGAQGELSNDGRAYLYSGFTGALIWKWVGQPGDRARFGEAVACAGDANGDGVPDLLIGEPESSDPRPDAGNAHLFSGRTGILLYTFRGVGKRELLGSSVAGIGDVNQDGFDDMLIGATVHDENNVELGGAFVFAGNDLWLQATHRRTPTSRTITLDTRGGPPGGVAVLYLTDWSSTPGPRFVQQGRLDGNGDWSTSFAVPPSLWGYSATFQAFAAPTEVGAVGGGASGSPWIDSSPATVAIPP